MSHTTLIVKHVEKERNNAHNQTGCAHIKKWIIKLPRTCAYQIISQASTECFLSFWSSNFSIRMLNSIFHLLGIQGKYQ